LSIAEKLLNELKAREDVREALAQELLPVIFKNRRLRLAILTALYRDIATREDVEKSRMEIREDVEKFREEIKGDFEKLRVEVKEDIEKLRTQISELSKRVGLLEQRMAKVEGQLSVLVKLFIAFNVPILVGIIGILLKMVLSP